MKKAILHVLSEVGEPLAYKELNEEVERYMEANDVPDEIYPSSGSGSLLWLTKTVQLDLEARDEVRRIKDTFLKFELAKIVIPLRSYDC
jgi:hypothetical protein